MAQGRRECALQCARPGENGSGPGGWWRTDRELHPGLTSTNAGRTGRRPAIPDDGSVPGGQGVAGSSPDSPTVFPQVTVCAASRQGPAS